MGQAKRRKEAMQGLIADVASIAHAMREVVGAMTHGHGADCVAYALAGAEVLRRMGHPAVAVAGSAVWRVGPGDADSLVHALELFGKDPDVSGAEDQGMFHAWIEVGPYIVDFTTFAFADKAARLDEVDGQTTSVQWCPEYLVVEAASSRRLQEVTQASNAGVYAYVRHSRVEQVVLTGNDEFDVKGHADLIQLVARHGKNATVATVDPSGELVNGLESARARSKEQGLITVYTPK